MFQCLTLCCPIETGLPTVLAPFLAIIRAPYFASPFKVVALDALQVFFNSNIFGFSIKSQICDSLLDIVDAVTKYVFIYSLNCVKMLIILLSYRCRFIQTDVASDELAQMRIIQTLRCMVKPSCNLRQYLPNDALWQIVEKLYVNLLSGGKIMVHLYCRSFRPSFCIYRFS